MFGLNHREQAALRKLSTPRKIQDFLDRLFVATYCFIALNVLIASLEALRGEPTPRLKMLFAIGVPLAYLAVIAALMLF
ncbi:MAG: hypothetical protein ACKOKC_12800 [Chthoniobacterales bacterium]